jgi:hypothetical protein
MMSRCITIVTLAVLVLAGCREEDGFMGGPGGARAYVNSDPPGARILVDSRQTGRVTPDTITGLTGRREITARLDTLSTSYRYTAQLTLTTEDTLALVDGPLVVRCSMPGCYRDLLRHLAGNRLRFAANPVGTFFLADGSGEGILWPANTKNSYASAGIPLFAALMPFNAQFDTVAIGMYDTQYLAGRPVPILEEDVAGLRLRQSTWIVPPANRLAVATVRGVRIEESVLATSTVDDAVVLKLVFHNITGEPRYRLVDPHLPEAGLSFHNAYIGFALDADIGTSTDDLLSYDLDLNMAFAYDARFQESGFGGGYNIQPGLVGLRVLEAPAATTVVLNGWARQTGAGDWFAGTTNEGTGWGMMSGLRVYSPDHPNPRIGHLPQSPGDVRIMVSAGPLTLAPGDSAAITVAVVIAPPVQGTFTSGTQLDPGSPTDTNRPLHRVAGHLFDRARTVSELLVLMNR